jgi:choice-of-anchor C domain-containing protein
MMRVLSCALVLLSASPAFADFIVNGSFENPQPSNGYLTYYAGSTDIPGWLVTAGSVDVVSVLSWPGPPRTAFDGTQWLDLDGTSAGGIAQSFATTAGQQYNLSFAYANNPLGGPAVASATVSLSDSAGVLFGSSLTHGSTTQSNPNWTVFQTSFVARESSTTIEFTSTDPSTSTGGIALDEVSVTAAAPEPSTFVMALAGIGVISLVRRRNRKHRRLGG